MDVTLGLDVGTGSTKVGLIDAAGRLLAVGRSAHPPAEPRPGWSEADPERWLAAAGRAASVALAASADASIRVVGVGLSGQMHGVVACGPGTEPLRPAVLWSDRRSEPDLAALARCLTPEVRSQLGNPLVAGMAGPTLAALARLEPSTVERIETVLQPKDWIRARLTGVAATDPSDASATLLWDVTGDRWSEAAAAAFAVDRHWLPPVLAATDVAGELLPAGADALGVVPGVPVAIGAADTAAALLGAGVAMGETQLSTGTGGQLAKRLAAPSTDPSGRTHLYRDAGRSWYAMAAIQNAGIAVEWVKRLLGADDAEIEAAMTTRRSDTAGGGPGDGGPGDDAIDDAIVFLPYLTGERTPHLDPTLAGRWTGLRPGTTRSALIRSVFHGVALALRDGLDALEAAGHHIDEALLAGGGSLAPWWRQLLADALEIPLVAHDAADASVRGAGLLAWASLGVEIDPAETVTRASPVEPSSAGTATMAVARERFAAALAAGGP